MLSDFKFAVRSLLKTPGFTATAVLILAVAIGASTALFSVLQATVLRPLQYHDPGSLVSVWSVDPAHEINRPLISWPKYERMKAAQDVFVGAAAYVGSPFPLRVGNAPARQIAGSYVSANFLRLTGIRPVRGRDFTAQDDGREASPAVMIGEKLWRREFGSDPEAIGRVITLDGVRRTIIAILPPLPAPFDTCEVLVPRPTEIPAIPAQARSFLAVYQVIARLQPGVTLAAANERMTAIGRQFNADNPGHPDSVARTELRTITQQVLGPVDRVFWILAAAVGAVLLIACANVAYLFIVRATVRRREMAIRLALGAGRRELVRLFLAESVVFSVVAAVLAVPVAWAVLKAVIALAGTRLPRAGEISMDPGVLLFCGVTALLCAAAVALPPGLDALRRSSNPAGDTVLRATASRRDKNFRAALIIFQVQLSLVLVICSGLLVASFVRLTSTDAGIDPHNTAFGFVTLPSSKYGNVERNRQFFSRMEEELRAAPELAAAGAVSIMPLSGPPLPALSYAVPGKPFLPMPQGPSASMQLATPGYFPALGIELREGRFFTVHDRADTENVVVINESLARKISPQASPVNQILRIGSEQGVHRIVGVMKDVKTSGIALPASDEIYKPYAQLDMTFPFMTLVARTRPGLDADAALAVLQRVVAKVDPDLPLAYAQTMRDLLADSLGVQRLAVTLLLGFALLALMLALTGLHGVLTYTVSQRTGELGIRMALGARQGQVVRLVLTQGMRLVLMGLIVGLGVSMLVTPVMRSMLYEVDPLDPALLGGVTFLFGAVAAIACLLPSLRASRIDPMVALRAG